MLGAPCACLLKVVGKFLVWHLKIELKSRVTPEEWGVPEITVPRQGYLPILLNLHDLDSGVANPRDLASRKWKVNWYACVHSDACLPLIFWLLWHYGQSVRNVGIHHHSLTFSSVQYFKGKKMQGKKSMHCFNQFHFKSRDNSNVLGFHLCVAILACGKIGVYVYEVWQY